MEDEDKKIEELERAPEEYTEKKDLKLYVKGLVCTSALLLKQDYTT